MVRTPDARPMRLLHVGAFSVGKGGLQLMDLLVEARKEHLDVEAVVVGGYAAIDESFLVARSRELGVTDRLTVRGRLTREEVDRLYDESHYLFHYTAIDGSPRVVLEALSRGLPVIGSNHPGIRVLDPEGVFIRIIDEWDARRVVAWLQEDQKDPAAYLDRSRRGKAAVAKAFCPDRVSRRYLELYEELLRRRPRTESPAL